MTSKYNFEISKEKSEMFKKAPTNYETRGVIAFRPYDIFSVDLVDMSNKPHNGYKYILNCVDVFSRKLCSVLLKSKDTASLKSGLQVCFSTLNKPNKIWSDQESGLLSLEMQRYFTKINVQVYHTFSKHKSAIVERLNRTMKEQMVKSDNLATWSDFVPQFVKAYNETIHSSINTTPNQAVKEDVDVVQSKNIDNYNKPRNEDERQFKVGDKVRISVVKGVLEKKTFTENYSKEIFTIKTVLPTNPTTYILNDAKGEVIKGSFYKAELLKTT